tara:strand:- start:131 stop:526 length:396 start_codon:yes stop_codon:yes gene_type:complete
MILFLLSTLAWGQPPEYTYLERGMEAPFSGRLFNDTASQLLSDQIADATDRCQIEMDYQIGILLAEKEQEINKLRSQHKLDKQTLEAKVQALETRIQGLEKIKTPPKKKLWFSFGLITGVGITIAIANAVN